jgi:DNA-binding GntR family transcriptional regulator
MSSRALPASAIVAAAVQDRITSGELQPGDRTPSARELAREFAVSAATASKALNQLAVLGLVGARPGVGMIVLHGGTSRLLAKSRHDLASRTGAVNRGGEHAKRLSAQEEEATESVRTALRIDTTRAFCRRRIRYDAKNRPIEYSESWFTPELAGQAPRLSNLEPIEEGTLNYIAQVTGRTVGATHEELYARQADEQLARHGIAKVGSPVLVVEFVAYDDNEQPLTYEIAAHPEGERITSGLQQA